MSQPDPWEEEKIRRLKEMGAKKEESRAEAQPDGPAPEAEAPAAPPREERSHTTPRHHAGEPFTVALATSIALLIAAIVIYPLCLVPAALVFRDADWIRWTAAGLAVLFVAPMRAVLERLSWPGDRRLGVFGTAAVLAGGVLITTILVFALSTLKSQKQAAEAVDRHNIVSERQLPLAGYEHEKQTKKYLEKVREIRASVTPPPREDTETWYADYKRIYVEPLVEMGYEFDITLGKATERYTGRPIRQKESDSINLLIFNGVCFRGKLFNDGLISSDTAGKLTNLALQWSERLAPEGAVSAPQGDFVHFERHCPFTDISVLKVK